MLIEAKPRYKEEHYRSNTFFTLGQQPASHQWHYNQSSPFQAESPSHIPIFHNHLSSTWLHFNCRYHHQAFTSRKVGCDYCRRRERWHPYDYKLTTRKSQDKRSSFLHEQDKILQRSHFPFITQNYKQNQKSHLKNHSFTGMSCICIFSSWTISGIIIIGIFCSLIQCLFFATCLLYVLFI